MNGVLRVLLVDDSPADRSMVERHLRREFPDVQVEQVSGAAAVDRALEQGGFDLVITDYRLRWTDGLAVLGTVKARMPDCPVIMFTGTGSEEVAVEAMKRGLDDYVVKSQKHMVRPLASARLALERARQRSAAREIEERFARLFENVPLGLYRTAPDGRVLDVNPAYAQMFGFTSPEQVLEFRATDFYADPVDRVRLMTMLESEGVVHGFEYWARRRDGTVFWAENNTRAIRDAGGRVQFLEGTVQDISKRKLFEEAIREQSRHLLLLHNITRAALDTPDYPTLLQTLANRLIEVVGADACNINLWDEAQKIPVLGAAGGRDGRLSPWVQPEPGETTLTGSCLAAGRAIAVDDLSDTPYISRRIAAGLPYRSALAAPFIAGEEKIGAAIMYFMEPRQFAPDDIERSEQAVSLLALAVARARLLEVARRNADDLDAQARLLKGLIGTREMDERLRHALDWAMEIAGVEMGGIMLMEHGEPVPRVWKGVSDGILAGIRALPSDLVLELARRVIIIRERLDEQGQMFGFAKREGIQVWASIPLYLPQQQEGEDREQWSGAIILGSRDFDALPEHKVRAVESASRQISLAIDHSRAYIRAEERLSRLQTLHNIDMAVTSSMDLRVTLSVLLQEVANHLRVDAGAVLLLNRHTHLLEYAAAHGFTTGAHRGIRLRLGECPAGRAAMERRIIVIPRLLGGEGEAQSEMVAGERFVGQIAVPLVAKAHVKGVLELFHRSPLDLDPEWVGFLEGLAAQAAIAVDSATLFEDLQRSSADLAMAYDAMLEGWARWLDLRERDAPGHTQRVTDMTLRLASALGVPEADLVHVRRGVLLHDIGKIAISDAILRKAGPLTDEEWDVVRRHPLDAYEMLSPIQFLKPALDIVLHHHERWDGTGYPHGLRGEQIPLVARIFAVVDMWHELRSERPYREAWDAGRAREYIREQAGKHFDPRVARAFLRMIGE